MNLNIHLFVLTKKLRSSVILKKINSFFSISNKLKLTMLSTKSNVFTQRTLKFYLRIVFFYLLYEEILFTLKHLKLTFRSNDILSFKKKPKKIQSSIFNTFFFKRNFWFHYGYKIDKTWKMANFFSLVLFNITSLRYSYLVNKRKYFQFKKKKTGKLTKFICSLFNFYLQDLKKNPEVFKKITLLNNLQQVSKISQYFNFSLKHLECFKNIFAFTLLSVPYIAFYSFLLDQTYIWSDLINELQVYFQKGFM